MSLFEKILQSMLLAGEIAVPLFVHSPHGLLIANASEEFVASLPQVLTQAPAPAIPAAPVPIPVGTNVMTFEPPIKPAAQG